MDQNHLKYLRQLIKRSTGQSNLILFLLLPFSICSISSCVEDIRFGNGVRVEIVNGTNSSVEDLTFTTTEELDSVTITSIDAGAKCSKFLSMKKNQVDGAYNLIFKRSNGKVDTITAGYYTNGWPSERHILFEIDDDSVWVEFDGKKMVN